MITLEKKLLSVISGGCDECNQDQTVVESNDNQNVVENHSDISSSLSHFEPIFSLDQ